ncbi:hypothetical protein FK513_29320, partial [Klebsiella pneumoniae]|nr:hypothetical protein [Klebsiella pneumoniae]
GTERVAPAHAPRFVAADRQRWPVTIGLGAVLASALLALRQAARQAKTLIANRAAQSLPAWRRLVTPALGGLTAGTLLWLWQRRSVARCCSHYAPAL